MVFQEKPLSTTTMFVKSRTCFLFPHQTSCRITTKFLKAIGQESFHLKWSDWCPNSIILHANAIRNIKFPYHFIIHIPFLVKMPWFLPKEIFSSWSQAIVLCSRHVHWHSFFYSNLVSIVLHMSTHNLKCKWGSISMDPLSTNNINIFFYSPGWASCRKIEAALWNTILLQPAHS